MGSGFPRVPHLPGPKTLWAMILVLAPLPGHLNHQPSTLLLVW